MARREFATAYKKWLDAGEAPPVELLIGRAYATQYCAKSAQDYNEIWADFEWARCQATSRDTQFAMVRQKVEDQQRREKYRASTDAKDHSGLGFVKEEIDHLEIKDITSMLLAVKGWEMEKDSGYVVSPATEIKLLVKLLRTFRIFALTPMNVLAKVRAVSLAWGVGLLGYRTCYLG